MVKAPQGPTAAVACGEKGGKWRNRRHKQLGTAPGASPGVSELKAGWSRPTHKHTLKSKLLFCLGDYLGETTREERREALLPALCVLPLTCWCCRGRLSQPPWRRGWVAGWTKTGRGDCILQRVSSCRMEAGTDAESTNGRRIGVWKKKDKEEEKKNKKRTRLNARLMLGKN